MLEPDLYGRTRGTLIFDLGGSTHEAAKSKLKQHLALIFDSGAALKIKSHAKFEMYESHGTLIVN